MPKISVIIPVYNVESYLPACLDSVLAQTFTDFEAIVVNDGSTDKSAEIIAEYAKKDARIKVITQENQGVVVARNNAIAHAHGKYIYPLDGDDKIAPNCLEKLHQAMCRHKGDVICSLVEMFGENSGLFYLEKPTILKMSKSNQVVISALFAKDDWIKYGGYDLNMKDGLEDWEFWLNFVFDHKKFYCVEERLFFYRKLKKSRTTLAQMNKQQLERYIIQKHPQMRFYRFLGKVIKIFYRKKSRMATVL